MIQKTTVGEAGKDKFFTEELSVIVARIVKTMGDLQPAALEVCWLENGKEQPDIAFRVEFMDDSMDEHYNNYMRRQLAKLKIEVGAAYESLPLFDKPKISCLALPADGGKYLIACSLEEDDRLAVEVEREVAACIAVMHKVVEPSAMDAFITELKLSPRRLERVEQWLLRSKEKAAHEWRG